MTIQIILFGLVKLSGSLQIYGYYAYIKYMHNIKLENIFIKYIIQLYKIKYVTISANNEK